MTNEEIYAYFMLKGIIDNKMEVPGSIKTLTDVEEIKLNRFATKVYIAGCISQEINYDKTVRVLMDKTDIIKAFSKYIVFDGNIYSIPDIDAILDDVVGNALDKLDVDDSYLLCKECGSPLMSEGNCSNLLCKCNKIIVTHDKYI